MSKELTLHSAEELVAFGSNLAASLTGGELIFLSGELGAGKTTLVRGILQALGHDGAVKSPTFAIVESYLGLKLAVDHFDLYRLQTIEELELLGWRDYLAAKSVIIIEWPERACGYLPKPDIEVKIDYKSANTRIVFTNDFR